MNQKSKAKFFEPFQVLHSVGKQAYKLEWPAKWRIYNVFHALLLEQDTIKKGRMNKFAEVPEFNIGNDMEYQIEAI